MVDGGNSFLDELLEQEGSTSGEDAGHTPLPTMTPEHVDMCAFSSWYPILKRVTFRSTIIPLPEEFVEYLNADGLFLPLDENGQAQPNYIHNINSDDDDSDAASFSDAQNQGESKEETDDDDSKIPSFPMLESQIKDAIQDLGGKVLPKLNWSSPKDATWMALDGTLCCNNLSDVLLLLKSSDFIAHDLSHAYDDCVPTNDQESLPKRPKVFELVLRKWQNLNPSMEFRCFVKDKTLVGACQRDFLNYYDFLHENRPRIERDLISFYDNELKDTFPESSFVFDAYISAKGKVYLIDINVFGEKTDSLLFFWTEIMRASEFTMRLVEESQSSHSLQPMFATNRVPKEAIDLSDGVGIEEFAKRFAEEFKLSVGENEDEGRGS
ncbi:hypothetical protein HDU97_003518 [Phlyctochytrium planicorne]|nr:hypothetical protein HDU97_003518 [Phlyctochytrium planicorne]